jgi:hypothetical protein
MRMKFWRSSSSSEDVQKDLAKTGRALALKAVASLFSLREIAADPWKEIVECYRSLAAGQSLDPETTAAGMLAELVCSPGLEIARSFAARIPPTGECDVYALVADAVIADRVARSNPSVPEPHSRLAASLYALMPKYYQTSDNYLAGSLRILSEYIAFFAMRNDFRGAFAEASSLTAVTSHLASRYGIYRYVSSVVEVGEKVLHENTGAAGRDAVGYWTVANNLANLHIALAQDQPPAAARHYKDALRCADTALAALERAAGHDVQEMRETTLQKLAQLHARLALENIDVARHAVEARRFPSSISPEPWIAPPPPNGSRECRPRWRPIVRNRTRTNTAAEPQRLALNVLWPRIGLATGRRSPPAALQKRGEQKEERGRPRRFSTLSTANSAPNSIA